MGQPHWLDPPGGLEVRRGAVRDKLKRHVGTWAKPLPTRHESWGEAKLDVWLLFGNHQIVTLLQVRLLQCSHDCFQRGPISHI